MGSDTNVELIFWLVGNVGLPLAEDLYKTWTSEGKDWKAEVTKLRQEGLPSWPELKAGTKLGE